MYGKLRIILAYSKKGKDFATFYQEKCKYILGCFIPFTAYGWWLIYETKRHNRMHQLENTEANIALEPLLFAEKDRMALKLFRQNCELEEELMKDNPDWKLGTLYGEPIFFDLKNRGIMPHGYELYAHTNIAFGEELSKRYYVRSQGAFMEQITRRNPQVPTNEDYVKNY